MSRVQTSVDIPGTRQANVGVPSGRLSVPMPRGGVGPALAEAGEALSKFGAGMLKVERARKITKGQNGFLTTVFDAVEEAKKSETGSEYNIFDGIVKKARSEIESEKDSVVRDDLLRRFDFISERGSLQVRTIQAAKYTRDARLLLDETADELIKSIRHGGMAAIEAMDTFDDLAEKWTGTAFPEKGASGAQTLRKEFASHAVRAKIGQLIEDDPRSAFKYMELDVEGIVSDNLTETEVRSLRNIAEKAVNKKDGIEAENAILVAEAELRAILERPDTHFGGEGFTKVFREFVNLFIPMPGFKIPGRFVPGRAATGDDISIILGREFLEQYAARGDKDRFDAIYAVMPEGNMKDKAKALFVKATKAREDEETGAAALEQMFSRGIFKKGDGPQDLPSRNKVSNELMERGHPLPKIAGFFAKLGGPMPPVVVNRLNRSFDQATLDIAEGFGVLSAIRAVDSEAAVRVAHSVKDNLLAETTLEALSGLDPESDEFGRAVALLSNANTPMSLDNAHIRMIGDEKEDLDPIVSPEQSLGNWIWDIQKWQAHTIFGIPSRFGESTVEMTTEARRTMAGRYRFEFLRLNTRIGSGATDDQLDQISKQAMSNAASTMGDDFASVVSDRNFWTMPIFKIVPADVGIGSINNMDREGLSKFIHGLFGFNDRLNGTADIRPQLRFFLNEKVYIPAFGDGGVVGYMQWDRLRNDVRYVTPDTDISAFKSIDREFIGTYSPDQRIKDAHLYYNADYGDNNRTTARNAGVFSEVTIMARNEFHGLNGRYPESDQDKAEFSVIANDMMAKFGWKRGQVGIEAPDNRAIQISGQKWKGSAE